MRLLIPLTLLAVWRRCVGLWISALNVQYRDIQLIVPFLGEI
jgi:ABC-type polysaccharide/polyol phosphate export permease